MKTTPIKLKIGDRVKFKAGGDSHIYTVYDIYPPEMVSLGLRDYPDIEQDGQVKSIQLIKVRGGVL